MAEPKLQIENRVYQQEAAIRTLSGWLAQEFPHFDSEVIERILNGENVEESENKDG